ncbi:uncharacterized protein PITG_00586 [Phytophthora infestans T30-4]|uniref:Tc1-like transposase DDE domain-containing protein n=1 Tax=Phytophthora infestans (strain T30-4) TaxID=403677 RepID=D0MR69_PHYIT|nr:uncharacterized protein PITG_00586 [Phytophthora infestans T30-4]EEY57988.1 conserved hypothetical protein [Phytophthora infestans T30-4]|eukprot:XP_002909174.1 conserved hypothetical protein [Phytophthora infestans T30-4]
MKQYHKEPQYTSTDANFNLWSPRTRGRSIRGRRAVKKHSNEFTRSTLCKYEDVSNIGVVLDSAPCHAPAETVFNEPEFQAATLLRFGPDSPMLNPIENVLSAFKSKVKDYMTGRRVHNIAVPQGTTMKAHRHQFLQEAAHTLFPLVATAPLNVSCYRYTLTFHVKVTDFDNMPVGRCLMEIS